MSPSLSMASMSSKAASPALSHTVPAKLTYWPQLVSPLFTVHITSHCLTLGILLFAHCPDFECQSRVLVPSHRGRKEKVGKGQEGRWFWLNTLLLTTVSVPPHIHRGIWSCEWASSIPPTTRGALVESRWQELPPHSGSESARRNLGGGRHSLWFPQEPLCHIQV